MGVDSSNYRFKNKESKESILKLIDKVYQKTYNSELRITITSTSKEQIKKVVSEISLELITFGINFTTNELGKFESEIQNNSEELKTLNISYPYDNEAPNSNTIRLTYNKSNKDSTAFISLNNQSSGKAISHLSNFLYAINEYSEYGLESDSDIEEFATNVVNLNSMLKNQNKWIYKTGCITFEPFNEKKDIESETTYKSISGLKVEFSKIHAMAYKAYGSVKVLKEIKQQFLPNMYNVNFTADKLNLALIAEKLNSEDIRCNFFFKLNEVNDINELKEPLENNELSIELSYATLEEDTSASFSLYLSGKSVNELDFDLFIDVEASEDYKNRVLELFENKLEYIGDG